MLKQMVKKQHVDGEIFYYFEDKPEQTFEDVVIGVGFPAEQAGYVCAVASELIEDELKRSVWHLHLLHEDEAANLVETFDRIADFISTFQANGVYCFPDEIVNRFLVRYRAELTLRDPRRFSLRAAPHSQDGRLAYHFNLIASRLRPGSKTLHLGAESRIPGILTAQDGDVHKATAEQCPAIAGFGAAVAALTQKEGYQGVKDLPRKAVMESDDEPLPADHPYFKRFT